jgi:acetyl esterase/lipase
MIPKGTLPYELLHLPQHLWKIYNLPRENMVESRHYYGRNFRQYILFLRPKDMRNVRGVAVYVHGGAWMSGSPEMFKATAQALVDRGYVAFNWAYRLLPFYKHPHMREDISNALLLTLSLMREHGLEQHRLIVGGTSAGGHLAAHLLFNQAKLAEIGLNQAIFKGFFSYVSPLDLDKMPSSTVIRLYAGKRGDASFETANPINYLTGDEGLPMLCVSGSSDGIVNTESVLSFAEKAGRSQPELVHYHMVKDGTHLDTSNTWIVPHSPERRFFDDWLEAVETLDEKHQ